MALKDIPLTSEQKIRIYHCATKMWYSSTRRNGRPAQIIEFRYPLNMDGNINERAWGDFWIPERSNESIMGKARKQYSVLGNVMNCEGRETVWDDEQHDYDLFQQPRKEQTNDNHTND